MGGLVDFLPSAKVKNLNWKILCCCCNNGFGYLYNKQMIYMI
jgi:hypothetical protein